MNNEMPAEDLEQKDQRSLIFQILYAIESHNYDVNLKNLIEDFTNNFNIILKDDSKLFNKISNIVLSKDEVDLKILPLISSNWKPERVGVVTKLILRIGAWEILNSKLNQAIIINESIELAKCFAEKDAYKFINGILDKFAYKYKLDS